MASPANLKPAPCRWSYAPSPLPHFRQQSLHLAHPGSDILRNEAEGEGLLGVPRLYAPHTVLLPPVHQWKLPVIELSQLVEVHLMDGLRRQLVYEDLSIGGGCA